MLLAILLDQIVKIPETAIITGICQKSHKRLPLWTSTKDLKFFGRSKGAWRIEDLIKEKEEEKEI